MTKNSVETTRIYNHLKQSDGQSDIFQNLPKSNTSIISEWNNVYHHMVYKQPNVFSENYYVATHADIHTADKTAKIEIDTEYFDTLDKNSEQKLTSKSAVLELESAAGALTYYSGNDNNAFEQENSSLCTKNDSSAYERASNLYEQVNNSLWATDNDNIHSIETTHAYNQLKISERRYDTSPCSKNDTISDWNNVNHILEKCSKHKSDSNFVVFEVESTIGALTHYTDNDNNACEQNNNTCGQTDHSLCTTNDNNTYEQPNNSLCTKNNINAYEQTNKTSYKTNDNNAYEQPNKSSSSENDNNAYEHANKSLSTRKNFSAYEQANNFSCATNSDSKRNKETSHIYNHLTSAEGQCDTLQNLPSCTTSSISDWNNVYHNIGDGCYSSIDGSPNSLTNNIAKKLEDNSSNRPR